MLKMAWFFHFLLIFLCFLGLTGAGQESVQLLNLHETTNLHLLRESSDSPVAVSVSVRDLNEISKSVLLAETWVRTYVLTHYPLTKITTIVVGNNLLCQKDQKHNLGLILPSVKDIYYSLTRWGLEKEIKVSPVFSSNCLDPFKEDDDDLSEKIVINHLLEFLHSINSTYSINPPSKLSHLSDKTITFVSSHLENMKKFGFLSLNEVNVLIYTTTPKSRTKPLSRKLSEFDSKVINPYPARPTPLPEISPIHSSIGYSVPAHIVKNPQPPTSSPPTYSFPLASPPPFSFPLTSPPPMPFSIAPELPPPDTFPASPPPFGGYSLPPCNPIGVAPIGVAPSPEPAAGGVVQSLWCVAKPTVPAETLQEAMDYACGEGGADCEEIAPHGSCFYPDTVVAHASYAFNSYWQKTKKNGGTCGFGGTAMIINADPSFLHCRFVLS